MAQFRPICVYSKGAKENLFLNITSRHTRNLACIRNGK